MIQTAAAPASTVAPVAPVAPAPVFHTGRGHWLKKPLDQSWFAAPVPHIEHPRWSTEEEAEALLARDGYLVIPDAFTSDQVDQLLHYAIHGGQPDSAYEVAQWCFNKNLALDHQHDPTWLWTADREPALGQLDRLLCSDCHCANGSVWVTGPGRSMPFHVDYRAIDLPPDAALPPELTMPCLAAVFIVALDDQVMEQGPTMVVPGSHLRAPGPRQAPIPSRAILLKRGQGLILRSDLCHGAMMNVGPRRRYHYHSNWGAGVFPAPAPMMRRELWDPAVIAAATPCQRRVLGDWPLQFHDREVRYQARMSAPAPAPASA